jgi:hypothetical protein
LGCAGRAYFLCIDVEIEFSLEIFTEISVLMFILHDLKSACFPSGANSALTQQMTTTDYKWESGIIYGKSKKREVKELKNTK